LLCAVKVSVLDSVPDLDMLAYLPQLLDGLMNLLSDPNREIRVAAHKCMMEFLVEIQVRHNTVQFACLGFALCSTATHTVGMAHCSCRV
jgi:vacuole morphology and inheritance protein 14